MNEDDSIRYRRRDFLSITGAIVATLALTGLPRSSRAVETARFKIGIIGSGRIGGTLGGLWVKAGHEVMFSSLDIEHDKVLATSLGAKASAGTPNEAAKFGEVLLFSVPYAALPRLGQDLKESIQGKVLLDTCNPIPARDGDMAIEAKAKGTGVASPQLLPGARLVRAFNSVGYSMLQSEAHRSDARVPPYRERRLFPAPPATEPPRSSPGRRKGASPISRSRAGPRPPATPGFPAVHA